MDEKVKEISSAYLNASFNNISMHELGEDWVCWLKESSGKAGGLRLIVPKNLKCEPFFIASHQGATKEHGVSSDYAVRIDIDKKEFKKVADLISNYIDLSALNIYKLLIKKELRSTYIYINSPKKMLFQFYQNFPTVPISLERQNNHGGYNLDGTI